VQREIAEKRERKQRHLAGVQSQLEHMSRHLAALEFRPSAAKSTNARHATGSSAPAARAERR
jgi:hypothetical protein